MKDREMKLLIILVILISGAFFLYNRDQRRAEEIREQQRIEQEEREIQRIKEEKALLLEKEKQEKLKAERKKEEERIRKENELKEKEEAERKIAEQKKIEEQKQRELRIQKEQEEAARLAKEEEERQKKLEAQCPACDGTGKVSQTVGSAKMKVACSLCNGTGEKPNLSGSEATPGTQKSSDEIQKLSNYIDDTASNVQELETGLKEIETFSRMVDEFMNCYNNKSHFSSSTITTRPGSSSTRGSKGIRTVKGTGQTNSDYYYKGGWKTMREVYEDWEKISEKMYKKLVSLKAPRNVNSPLRLLNNKCMMKQTPSFAVPQIKEEADKSIEYLKKYIESRKGEISKARAKLSELQSPKS